MANISKIEYFGKVLIDLSEDTVTAETLIKGVTAHDKTGTQITGTAETGSDTSDATATAGDIAYEKTAYVNGEKITGTLREVKSGGTATGYSGATPSVSGTELKFSKEATVDRIWRTGGTIFLKAPLTEFGDAAAEDVAAGKTFTSAAGLKVAGTAQTSAASPVIESLEITENGTYTAPEGVDGYSPVTVNVPSSGDADEFEIEEPVYIYFYDYDGTLLYQYTPDEIQEMTELPDAPEHEGLVFQDWNWDLADIKNINHPL